MNLPTIIIAVIIAIVFVSIIARGVYNWKHHKGGCGCGSCPNSGLCHPRQQD